MFSTKTVGKGAENQGATPGDPSGTANKGSDECGIGVAGLGEDGHCNVLDDRSGIVSPAAWGSLAVTLYYLYYARKADRIAAETNFGADMVELTIRTVRNAADRPVVANLPFKTLTASRGTAARAPPSQVGQCPTRSA